VWRFGLVFVVSLLAASASGVLAIIVAEPCGTYEPATSDEESCPPTCVTCGCCSQSVEPTALDAGSVPLSTLADVISPLLPLPAAAPRDILHVPRPLQT
jgi:hypothetical protein